MQSSSPAPSRRHACSSVAFCLFPLFILPSNGDFYLELTAEQTLGHNQALFEHLDSVKGVCKSWMERRSALMIFPADLIVAVWTCPV
ncbi:hypothetical protein ILYODFUR_028749 [Ilyodon furcidens]|uniref:Uncharacterized protein n=1 Tax=Ilyodon furcidens TaxID=33524 RepID=A0ABV0VIN0_9TELE